MYIKACWLKTFDVKMPHNRIKIGRKLLKSLVIGSKPNMLLYTQYKHARSIFMLMYHRMYAGACAFPNFPRKILSTMLEAMTRIHSFACFNGRCFFFRSIFISLLTHRHCGFRQIHITECLHISNNYSIDKGGWIRKQMKCYYCEEKKRLDNIHCTTLSNVVLWNGYKKMGKI